MTYTLIYFINKTEFYELDFLKNLKYKNTIKLYNYMDVEKKSKLIVNCGVRH